MPLSLFTGWRKAHSSIDAALVSAFGIEGARLLRSSVYILWIDLATFFPGIDRRVLSTAELLNGMPPEVVRLTMALFGQMTGMYDTAHGLGDEFQIFMGALMGCRVEFL